MSSRWLLFVFFLISYQAIGQKQGPEKKENKNTLAFTFKKQATDNFDEISQDYHPCLLQ